MSGTDYSFTPNLGLYKPVTDRDVGNWGTHWNANADIIDGLFPPGSAPYNAKDYGAAGDGVTDDTAALQAAANAVPATGGTLYLPQGRYSVSATTLIKSLTRVVGDGWGSVIAANAAWQPGLQQLILNQNYAATSITDHDISFENLAFDYTNAPNVGGGGNPNAGRHCVSCRMVRNVQVRNCLFTAGTLGNNATAMVACDTTLVAGCVSHGTINASYDHWWNAQNAQVVNCYADGPQPQVFFNPEPTTGTGSYAANNFLMAGCTIITTGGGETSCRFEPLGAGTTVANVRVVGNHFSATHVLLRGAVTGAVVSGNTFVNTATGGVIGSWVSSGGTPDGIVVADNVIVNPSSSSGGGPIQIQIDGATITGNRITGTALGSTPGIDTASNAPVVIGNNVTTGVQNTIYATATTNRVSVPNGQGYAWKDTGGNLVTFNIGTDNHMVWVGTNATGAARQIMDIYQRSSTSALTWSVPLTFLAQMNIGAAGGPNIQAGAGAATGTQPAGSIWLRTDGATGTRLYVSAGGGTWNAVAGV